MLGDSLEADEHNDEDYSRGRGRSESFVNELEESEVRLKENILQQKLEGNDLVVSGTIGMQGGGGGGDALSFGKRSNGLATYDSMDDFQPVVKTQLSRKTLDIVTNLEHTKHHNSRAAPQASELFPQPVVNMSAEELEEEVALENQTKGKKRGSLQDENIKKDIRSTGLGNTREFASQDQGANNKKKAVSTASSQSTKSKDNRGGHGTKSKSKTGKSNSIMSMVNLHPYRKKNSSHGSGEREVPRGSNGNVKKGDASGLTLGSAMNENTNSHEDYDYHVKVLLLGDSGVGKTSLMLRFADNEFQPNLMSTAGVDFKVRYLENQKTKGKRIKCQIWDTAGQERFHVITRTYYRGSHGIALVYDVTNERSFEQINYWMNNIKNHAGKDVFVVLFGNKVDLPHRKVTYEQGKQAAAKHNALFYETSAKDGTNVLEAFEALSMNAVAIIESGMDSGSHPGQRQAGITMENKKKNCTIL